MEREALEAALRAGEGAQVEFKRCGSLPGNDVFETICSFANHFGGSLYLGVTNEGVLEAQGSTSRRRYVRAMGK
jgi:ATP-dependent DNA helicase RecG